MDVNKTDEKSMMGMEEFGWRFQTTYTDLPPSFFSFSAPDVVQSPSLVVVNEPLAASLGLDISACSHTQQAQLFSGSSLPSEATPFSQAYAGHQFGHYTMLGDGRAHVLGEHITPDGQRVDIQLKGSGRTPYARRGDGKAALGPMLREYIVSEAMHHLGIPTTRSLAVMATGETIEREASLPGAVLTRVASSHIRVGTFEFAASQPDEHALVALLDYTIARHYPELASHDNRALAFLEAVMVRQIDLVVNWMRVGFIHGVMNTDNMLVSGETIDYGPCAFMDVYDPDTVFSSIDYHGRYAYARQPHMAQWNSARLAEALLPCIAADRQQAVEKAEVCINRFPQLYQAKWLAMMRAKLGLLGEDSGDACLIVDLLQWMIDNQVDFTNTFRDLGVSLQQQKTPSHDADFVAWYRRWQTRLSKETQSDTSSLALMQAANPVVIPRNHRVEEVLSAAYKGDFVPVTRLLNVLAKPYQEREGLWVYQQPPGSEASGYQTFCGT